MKNFGLLIINKQPGDYVYGSSNVVTPTYQEDGQWTNFLVEGELQNKGTETMACTSFSEETILEMILKRQTGIEYNNSDRFRAKMSNTQSYGNYFFNVANSAKNDGWIDEDLWQYVQGWDEYYSPIPEQLKEAALLALEDWRVNYQWVEENPEAMVEALKHSPLQETIRFE